MTFAEINDSDSEVESLLDLDIVYPRCGSTDAQKMLSGSAAWARAPAGCDSISGDIPTVEGDANLLSLGLPSDTLNEGDRDMINRHLSSETHKKNALAKYGITYEIDVAKSIASEQGQITNFIRGSNGRGYWLSPRDEPARLEFFDFGGQLVGWFPGNVPQALEDTTFIMALYSELTDEPIALQTLDTLGKDSSWITRVVQAYRQFTEGHLP